LASIVLGMMLLVVVSVTALAMLHGQWATRRAAKQRRAILRLDTAIETAKSITENEWKAPLRLPISEPNNHWIEITKVKEKVDDDIYVATEWIAGKQLQTVRRAAEGTIQ